jgi:hypothetical protein
MVCHFISLSHCAIPVLLPMVQFKSHYFQDSEDSPEIVLLHMQISSLQIPRAFLHKNMAANTLTLRFSLKIETYTRRADIQEFTFEQFAGIHT